MHVVATAGHVDHGKSTLVKALTGAEPDRLAEERRRGLSIELGYVWTSLAGVGEVAFVDVPGHERFLRTMLAGVGPVPAVLFVVAADDDWMPQAAEHLAALDALGVEHGVVAVSRCDLADPAPMAERARRELTGTSLAGSPVVPVSGVRGTGLEELRTALATMVAGLRPPAADADVRLWVDRDFHVRGAGTVVTGTLPAGSIGAGDRLWTGTRMLRVRGLQTLGEPVESARGVARVALNLTPAEGGRLSADLDRGTALVTPDRWHFTRAVDVRLRRDGYGGDPGDPPTEASVHIGAAEVATRVRPFDETTARLTLGQALPLRIGDRAILRDPGSRRLWGVRILDPAPPALRRRGAGARRAVELGEHPGIPDAAAEVRRRGIVDATLLRRIGVATAAAGWLVGDAAAAEARERMLDRVRRHDAEHPLDPGIPVPALTRALELPGPEVTLSLVTAPLRVVEGRVQVATARALPSDLLRAVERLGEDWAEEPFAAPTADRLAELGLDRHGLAAAARAGLLLDLGEGIVLPPGADRQAAAQLAELPQPFTAGQARQCLGTTRRVVLPLLAHLDRVRLTLRHPDDRRSVR